jgi:hypothetical protein
MNRLSSAVLFVLAAAMILGASALGQAAERFGQASHEVAQKQSHGFERVGVVHGLKDLRSQVHAALRPSRIENGFEARVLTVSGANHARDLRSFGTIRQSPREIVRAMGALNPHAVATSNLARSLSTR